MKINRLLIIIAFLFSVNKAFTQEKLSLEDAIKIALENNFDIKISRNVTEISKNNVTPGNAGMLPVVTGNLNDLNRVETSEVDLASGGSRNARNAKNTNINYGASLNWRIFDGFRMFATYDRLQELQKLGELNFKLNVQNTIANVLTSYYNLIALNKQLEATKTALEVSRVRLKNANSRFKIGKGSKLELLAAKVDLSTDTSSLLVQKDLIKASKINLNQILGRPAEIEFAVEDTIILDKQLNYENTKSLVLAQNPELQTAVVNQKIAELSLKEIKGDRYPVIALTSGYNFSNSTSPPTGFAIRNNTRGLNYGFTASINIFNGFQQNRAETNAKLEIENAQFNLERTQQAIASQLLIAYQNYQTNLQLVTLEENNVEVAQENLNITLEKYRLGSIVPLELREAQRNFVDATVRYANSQFQAKLAEVAIKELAGNIQL
ncbi:outer membrane efflux protein BepC [Pedobacter glucosidilyticus]|nr:TolC family protein [Pedobacter glucosidilyticus]KHJ37588.1 outer membrane efflux protein BepC [Pedobacter glucosidilyticus]